jgi:radical SAM superfamily enzyme YgiQ (UPF0313 family)
MDGRPLDLSAILVYPNAREVALSSLGFLKVHGMLAARSAVADFAYLPGPPPSPVLSPAQGLLLGERTRREARAFDFLGFSVSYENDYVNVVRLLDMAGIEPVGERRSEAFPFIVIGGFTMFMNPRPLAPLADAIVVGEAEPVLGEMLEILAAAKSGGWSRGRLRERVSSLRGVLVPGAGQAAVERVWAQPDSFAPEPAGLPAGGDAHFGDMRLVEVGRGCGRGCLFCAAGCLYRPVRMREAAEILNAAGRARRVGLVGPAVADHPDLEGMIEILVEGGARIGVSSLRADRVTARLAGLLAEGGMKTATIAPETGSEDLRMRMGKKIIDGQLLDCVRVLAEAGIPTVKLYFMIGLPGETDEDVRAIAGLVGRLAEVRGRSRLSVSAAPFVPKPGTPLEDAPFADMKVLRRRAGLLKAIRAIRGCTLKVASLESAWLEAALARADESMAPLMLEAVQKGVNLRTHLKRSGYEAA